MERKVDMSTLFVRELGLPVRGLSERVTLCQRLEPDGSMLLFEKSRTPGCILHWSLAYGWDVRGYARNYDPGHDLVLTIEYADTGCPITEMSLGKFFAMLMNVPSWVSRIGCAALKVLPKNMLNCYFPMPFENIRMRLTNRSAYATEIWLMLNWQRYPKGTPITPLRLVATYSEAYPAPAAGQFQMADFTGRGFIAGFTMAMRSRDLSDHWFHNGGDLWLLDGEGEPRALRGCGGEDEFNMSFGIHPVQTEWMGSPYCPKTGADTVLGSGNEGIMYRILGPDPVHFDQSASLSFGSKANDVESVVYAYLDGGEPERLLTPESWKIWGPFECLTAKDFDRPEFPETAPVEGPMLYTPGFGQYIPAVRGRESGIGHKDQKKSLSFELPFEARTEHGWCDIARHLRGRHHNNPGTQPVDVSAYAEGVLNVPEAGAYALHVSFDDAIRIWVNGQVAYAGEHPNELDHATVNVNLNQGANRVMVKLSNKDNIQWRLWAFCLKARKHNQ
jgi:hypothetical protein